MVSARISLCLLSLVSLFVAPAAPAEARGADGSGAYATGRYRSLFAETGHSEKDMRAGNSA